MNFLDGMIDVLWASESGSARTGRQQERNFKIGHGPPSGSILHNSRGRSTAYCVWVMTLWNCATRCFRLPLTDAGTGTDRSPWANLWWLLEDFVLSWKPQEIRWSLENHHTIATRFAKKTSKLAAIKIKLMAKQAQRAKAGNKQKIETLRMTAPQSNKKSPSEKKNNQENNEVFL